MPPNASFIPATSPHEKVIQGSAIGGQGASNEFTGGQQNKMSNSNEKQEQRYKEIMKENDGKIFVINKGGGGGQVGTATAASLMRPNSGAKSGFSS